MKEILMTTNATDKIRIYFIEGSKLPYKLRVNSLADGDPVYSYKTYKGVEYYDYLYDGLQAFADDYDISL